MKWLVYTGLYLASCIAGAFMVSLLFPHISGFLTPRTGSSDSLIEQAIGSERPVLYDVAGLERWFLQSKNPRVLFVTDETCTDCARQWAELEQIGGSTEIITLVVGNKPEAYIWHLLHTKHMPGISLFVPPARQLSLIRMLNQQKCAFDGTLPYVALAQGNAGCTASWSGFTQASTLRHASAQFFANKSAFARH